MLLSLILLTLLYPSLSLFSSYSLPLLFLVSTSGTPTELPSSSDSEEALPGINTHTHTQTSSSDLPSLICPPTDILFVSCSSSTPSDEHKPGYALHKHKSCFWREGRTEARRTPKNNCNSSHPISPAHSFQFYPLSPCGGFSPFPYLELVDAVDQMQWQSVLTRIWGLTNHINSTFSSSTPGMRENLVDFFCNQFPLSLAAAVGISSPSCLLIRRAVYPIHFTQLPISIISILVCLLFPLFSVSLHSTRG